MDIEVPPPVRVRLAWLRNAARPGVAETVRATVPEKLLRLVRVTVELLEDELTRIVRDVGLADMEKSDTLTVIAVE